MSLWRLYVVFRRGRLRLPQDGHDYSVPRFPMVPTGSGLAKPARRSGQTPFIGCLVNHNRLLPPMFFVSVAYKGLRDCVSGLESTLAGSSISVACKGVRGGMISHRFEDRPVHVEGI